MKEETQLEFKKLEELLKQNMMLQIQILQFQIVGDKATDEMKTAAKKSIDFATNTITILQKP